MNFFIPNSTSHQNALDIYQGVKRFSEEQTNWIAAEQKVFAIRYRHNGHEYLAQVGEIDPSYGMVVCIFECESAFLVCTPNRGVITGFPIIVGRSSISDIEYFEIPTIT